MDNKPKVILRSLNEFEGSLSDESPSLKLNIVVKGRQDELVENVPSPL